MPTYSQARPPISEAIKREVRKKCFFGCVICGSPLFHYDHIVPYETVREHEAYNLILLCPDHHQAKTSGILPVSTVESATRNPFNQNSNYSGRYRLHSNGQVARVILGNVWFTFNFEKYPEREGFAAFSIDETTLIGIYHELGHFLLYMYGADSSGKDLFIIERGELAINTSAWDYTRSGRRIIVREAPSRRVILLFVKLDNGFEIRKGFVAHKNRGLRIERKRIVVLPSGSNISGITFKDCYCAINVGQSGVGQLTIP